MRKIPKLQKNQKELLEEWKDASTRFERSLKKTEEKLKEQSSIGRDVSETVHCSSCIWLIHFTHFRLSFLLIVILAERLYFFNGFPGFPLCTKTH